MQNTNTENKRYEINTNISAQLLLKHEALKWIVLLTSGDITKQKIKECQKWREISTEHEIAFQLARKLWLDIGNSDQLHLLNFEMKNTPIPVTPPLMILYVFHTHKYLLIVIFSIVCFLISFINNQHDYVTEYGQIKKFNLDNYGQITLNTNTALDTKFSKNKHEFSLNKGKVYFHLKPKSRPIIVKSGAYFIEFKSTDFIVNKNKYTTTISMLNGYAIVQNKNMKIKKINTNQKITIYKNHSHSIQNIDPKNILSWTSGKLIFNDTSIQQVLNTLEDYDKKIWFINLNKKNKEILINTTVNIKNIDNWLNGLNHITPINVKKFGKIIFIYDN